jgi:hypothetical protein
MTSGCRALRGGRGAEDAELVEGVAQSFLVVACEGRERS